MNFESKILSVLWKKEKEKNTSQNDALVLR